MTRHEEGNYILNLYVVANIPLPDAAVPKPTDPWTTSSDETLSTGLCHPYGSCSNEDRHFKPS